MAVSETVVVSTVSVIVVTAEAGATCSDSKLPPLAWVIVAETEPVSTCTSSVGAATDTVACVAPAAMVRVAPFESVTDTGVCAALLSVAV